MLIAVLWAGALLAYSNSFGAGFVFDNAVLIQRDPRITAATAHNLHLIWTGNYLYGASTGGLYRPLTTLSFLFNYAILGDGSNPAGFHWVNFGLHAVNIALVYLLALILLKKGGLAFVLAAVWGLHPVLTESVTNIVGRADMLAGFGVLAGLLCYIKSFATSGRRRFWWLCGLMLAAAIGLFAKESGVVVVAAMLVYDTAFPTAASWRGRAPGYLAVATVFLLYLYVRIHVAGDVLVTGTTFTDNPLVGAGFWTARLTALKVVWSDLRLLVWPRHLACDYSYNQVPLFTWRLRTWDDWKALAGLAVCAAAAFAIVRCYRRYHAVLFFIAFSFAALLPTSNLLTPIGTIMAERFLYLPAIGFFGCLVCGLDRACRESPRLTREAVALSVLACVTCAGRTYARNLDWQDDNRLWASAVAASPNSYKTHMGAASGQPLDRALHEMNEALAIVASLPDDLRPFTLYMNSGGLYRDEGDLEARKPGATTQTAVYWYQQARDMLLLAERNEMRTKKVPPEGVSFQTLQDLGSTYVRLSEFTKAAEVLERARNRRFAPESFEELAAAYRGQSDLRKAAVTLLESIVANPGITTLGPKLVEIYGKIDPQGCAVRSVGSSAKLNLECPLVHGDICTASRNMVRLYLQQGELDAADRTRRGAVAELGCGDKL